MNKGTIAHSQYTFFPANQEDNGTARCRMTLETMRNLNLVHGDVVLITSTQTNVSTICVAWNATTFTQNDCLQIDPWVLNGNKKWSVEIGDIVMMEVFREKIQTAQHVVLNVLEIDDNPKRFAKEPLPSVLNNDQRNWLWKQKLKASILNHIVKTGSFVNIDDPEQGTRLIIQVLSFTTPSQTIHPYTKITQHTQIDFVSLYPNENNLSTPSTISITNQNTNNEPPTHSVSNPINLSSKSNTVSNLGGLDKALNTLREMVMSPLLYPQLFKHIGIHPPRGILLKGVAGCGKTSLVREIVRECNADLMVINGSEVYGEYLGEAEEKLRNIFSEATERAKKGPCILFMDEIDALCPPRSTSNSGQESRVVGQLLTLIDGMNERGAMIIVAATNRPNSIDPALRRPGRFDRELEIGIPNVNERLDILKVHTRGLPLNENLDLKFIAEKCNGFVGADLAALCREATMHSLSKLKKLNQSRSENSHKDGPNFNLQDFSLDLKSFASIDMDDFFSAMKIVSPSILRGDIVDMNEVKWDDIGGLEHVKQQLREAVEWPIQYKDTFLKLGLLPPRGILLHGPPGNSKTNLVKAVANACRFTFLMLSGAAIFSPFMGDAEQTIRITFRKARQSAPSILFFDEVDAIVVKRGMNSSAEGVQERVLSTFLNEMDGIESLEGVLVIAATNRIDMLDPALLRPGRMDKILYVPTPDKISRRHILEIKTRKMPLEGDVNLDLIADLTVGFSGAELENLCRETAMLVLRENLHATKISMDSFLKVLQQRQKSQPTKKTSVVLTTKPFEFQPASIT